MAVRLIGSGVLLAWTEASHVALMAGGHHVIGVHVGAIEVARLESLLPLSPILAFIDGVVRSSIVACSSLTGEVVGLPSRDRVRNR